MVEASSPGRVSPKIKSIDVEANLLSERMSERERLLDALSRKGLAALALLVFTVFVLPAAYQIQSRMAAKEKTIAVEESTVARKLSDLKTQLAGVQPGIQDNQMLDLSRTYSGNFLSQITALLESSSSRMVFSGLKCEVLGGDLKVSAKAQAESYADARVFVDKSAKLPKTKSAVLKQWRQDAEFATSGVAFEVERVAEVGK